MELIGLIFIGICIIFASFVIAFSLDDRSNEGERELRNHINPPFTGKSKEMAEIIKRETPVDDFLKQNEIKS